MTTKHSIVILALLLAALVVPVVSAAPVEYPSEYSDLKQLVDNWMYGNGLRDRGYSDVAFQRATLYELRRQSILMEKQNELLAEQNELLGKLVNQSMPKETCIAESPIIPSNQSVPPPYIGCCKGEWKTADQLTAGDGSG
jgi:hypothetical protein